MRAAVGVAEGPAPLCSLLSPIFSPIQIPQAPPHDLLDHALVDVDAGAEGGGGGWGEEEGAAGGSADSQLHQRRPRARAERPGLRGVHLQGYGRRESDAALEIKKSRDHEEPRGAAFDWEESPTV